ncbi:MAG: ABC transporter ATP-binding protein/permease [Motiliproteus sp.]|nr:ABC transporter ATP-binding protein/permease [Motiliproteus sp.]MCW9053885.1 ABC transporter ATP-binding protein/permease [Motiliproteus sp.]
MNAETTPVSKRRVRYDWRYILTIASEHRRELIIANLVAVAATVAAVPVPLFMPLLVDEVLLEQPGALVGFFDHYFPESWHGPWLYVFGVFILTVVLRVISLVLNVWQGRQFTLISKDVIFRIRSGMLERLRRISMAEYETLGSGAVASHFVTDLDTVDRFVGESVSKLLVAALSILGTAVVLMWLHWPLALFILFMNPLVIYLTMVIGKQVKRLKQAENSAFEVFQGALTETLDAIQQIRSSNRERHYLSQLVDGADQVRKRSASFQWRSDAANRLSFMVFLVGFDLFRAISMMMVLLSDLSVGQMIAVFGYLWFMMAPVQELLGMQYAYYAADGALNRINRLMDLHEEPHYACKENPFADTDQISIHLQDIHFAYRSGEDVLNGINLEIGAGEKIALVGASGGGKSTLVQVLLGLYPSQRGTICFNGIPVERIGLETVRENVATVLQHPALFNGTVRSNLTLGREYQDQQLWQALEIAQLREFVENTAQQLDTRVGRQGVRLSGGQRQRLAIARMVLSDPKIVILDEATSALDTETEYALHRALHEFLQGRTTLIVAHRLSAVKQADHVYVFEDGQIIEQGSHQQLLAENGLYAKLYGERQRH